jgi:transcriptional regulator with XRE-family HTH domain
MEHDDLARQEHDDASDGVTAIRQRGRAHVPPKRSGNLHGVNEAQRWAEFGRFVTERREELGLGRRAAAKKAKLTESTLRALEAGYQTAYGGVRVLPNLTPDELDGLAAALEVDADDLHARLGRPAPHLVDATRADDESDGRASALARRIARLDERDRQLVAVLVDRLLERA